MASSIDKTKVKRGLLKELTKARGTRLAGNKESVEAGATKSWPNTKKRTSCTSPITKRSKVSHPTTASQPTPPNVAQPPTRDSRVTVSQTHNQSSEPANVDRQDEIITSARPTTNQGNSNTQLESGQSQMEDIVADSTSNKPNGRGKSKGIQLDFVLLKSGKVKLQFDMAIGRPKSLEDNQYLVGECGKIVRSCAPFRLKSFSAIEEDDYKLLIMRLQVKFVWDTQCPVANQFIRKTFAKIYNSWKADFGRKFLRHSNTADALVYRGRDISLADWQWWTEYVRSTEYQEVSKRNASNRAKQSYVHRAGSKPFVYYSKDSSTEDDVGEDSGDDNNGDGFLEQFRVTHWTAKKGWINESAKERYEKMKKLVEDSQSNPEGPISEYEARRIILCEKSGYVRGMGRSVLAPSRSTPYHHSAQASKIKSLESELGDMQSKMTEMWKMIETLQKERAMDSPGLGHSLRESHSPRVINDDNDECAS